MKHKDTFIVNVNINWRVLVVFGVILCILIAAYSVARAQNDNPPDTNTNQSEPLINSTDQNSPDVSEPAEVVCSDGFLPTTNGECIPAESVETNPMLINDDNSITISGLGSRHIYLTNANYATNHTLTACAVGYHMASLWEMLDISNMIYDNSHPAAYNKADSGYGAPSNWYGWVRTGFSSSNSITTGSGNCNTWTSISTGDYGVSVRLSNTWEAAPGDIVTWDATSFTCNYTGPVWCVGDFYQSYLPLAVNNH
jgi:hypothetical protein